jgi:hypothetical protein
MRGGRRRCSARFYKVAISCFILNPAVSNEFIHEGKGQVMQKVFVDMAPSRKMGGQLPDLSCRTGTGHAATI